MSSQSRSRDPKATGSKSKKKQVPWEKLIKEQDEYENEHFNLRTAKYDGLSPDAQMEGAGYSLKSPVNYTEVDDTRSLFDNGITKGHVKPSFNLSESMNSLNFRQMKPPRSSPFPKHDGDGSTIRHSSPERSGNGFHQTSPTLVRKSVQSLGPPDPQINPEIENAIISYSYIDLIDVLRYSTKNTVNTEVLRDAIRRDILVWLDAFSMYITIICSAHPIRIHDLLKYQRNIIWIYRETQDVSAWWRYDIAFRRKAELRQIQDWSYIDIDLYNTATSERARENLSCLPCLSREHTLKRCPFGEGARTNYPVVDIDGSPSLTNDAIDRALAHPEKLLKKPSDGLRLKFAFG